MNPHHGRTEAKPAVRLHPRFKVGDLVALINTAGAILPKHEERELLEARFEITRQLPDLRRSFHYRIKDTLTGQERAVTEERLEAFLCSSPVDNAMPEHPESAEQDAAPSDEMPIGCEQEATKSESELTIRSLNDGKPSLPRPARPAPARGR